MSHTLFVCSGKHTSNKFVVFCFLWLKSRSYLFVCHGMSMLQGLLVMLALSAAMVSASTECVPKKYGSGRIVCVCNSTYCDFVDPVTPLHHGQYVLYTSTKEGLRFHKTEGTFSELPSSFGARFQINSSVTYQTILGFGGAFTDGAGINILSLSSGAQENLLRSYYSSDGIEYNMGRVPVAGCDFSTHTYTYDDVENDVNLTHFNLTMEDFEYKIPLIKRAQHLSNKQLKLLAGAWSAPPWMKTNNDYSGFGFLKEEYYQEWANYQIRFLDAYKEEGLDFWGISTGNEPSNGIIPINRFNSMGWTPHSQRKWIAENLGPALKHSHHSDVKLLILDDQRFMLPWWIDIIMSNKTAAQYIDGIGVHWYWDTLVPPCLLDSTHSHHPNTFILSTEASVGDKPWDFIKVKLGSWNRGEQYMQDILQNMNHWVTGWIDWNLALDLHGGPNWARNFVDAAVIVNSTADEFYKQPMFYAVGHFSKFVPGGSVRVLIEPSSQKGITMTAFLRPDDSVVVVMYNERDSKRRLVIEDSIRGSVELTVASRSFNTLIYK